MPIVFYESSWGSLPAVPKTQREMTRPPEVEAKAAVIESKGYIFRTELLPGGVVNVWTERFDGTFVTSKSAENLPEAVQAAVDLLVEETYRREKLGDH